MVRGDALMPLDSRYRRLNSGCIARKLQIPETVSLWVSRGPGSNRGLVVVSENTAPTHLPDQTEDPDVKASTMLVR